MIKLTRLLKEAITEAADSNKEWYPVTVTSNTGDILNPGEHTFYSFDAEGDQYRVLVINSKRYLDVDFNTKGNVKYDNTNKGLQFRVMSTIASIVDKILARDKKNTLKGIKYHPIEGAKDKSKKYFNQLAGKEEDDSEGVNRRDKIYRAFIKNRYPTAAVTIDSDKNVWVNFKGEDPTVDVPASLRTDKPSREL